MIPRWKSLHVWLLYYGYGVFSYNLQTTRMCEKSCFRSVFSFQKNLFLKLYRNVKQNRDGNSKNNDYPSNQDSLIEQTTLVKLIWRKMESAKLTTSNITLLYTHKRCRRRPLEVWLVHIRLFTISIWWVQEKMKPSMNRQVILFRTGSIHAF